MTDEQKKARKVSAESGHIKWIKDHCLRTKDDEEDYVFISYKSDDYEKVLDEILYETCRKYGLRVYFDVAFDDDSDSWITQFYDNMCSTHCKAMVAFISNKYYTSYATLLEMMARKTRKAGGNGKFDKLFFLPIHLEPIHEILSEANTGLGTERFKNGHINNLVEEEVSLFNDIFNQLASKNPELLDLYNPSSHKEYYKEATEKEHAEGKIYLTESYCWELMKMVYPKAKNVNDGSNKSFEDVIHDKLSNGECGDSVFIPGWKQVTDDGGDSHGPTLPEPLKPPVTDTGTKTHEQRMISAVPEPQESHEKTISLPDFLKKYNNNTFKKDTFQQVRLVGQGEYAKYSSDYYPSTYFLVWGFVENLLKERGEEYIHFVNGKNPASKNPPFITVAEHERRKAEKHPVTYRRLELPGLEGYSMCRHYSQYDWVSIVLRKRIRELDIPLSAFSFEYEDSADLAPTPVRPEVSVEPEVPDSSEGDIVLRDLNGKTHTTKKTTNAPDGYIFTLYGERHCEPKLKNLMLTVFKETMGRHPDKLDQLVDKLPCLSRDVKIHKNAIPTTFRAGDYYIDKHDGREISIGTSLNQGQVLKYIGRLMQICGEPKENLDIVGYDY